MVVEVLILQNKNKNKTKQNKNQLQTIITADDALLHTNLQPGRAWRQRNKFRRDLWGLGASND